MEKRIALIIGVLSSALPLAADGAGWYVPDSPWYRTSSGDEYSWEEPMCASDVYPVGSLLKLTDDETGESFYVEVNDAKELPPDRSIVLNKPAADITGVSGPGYRSGTIEVHFPVEEQTLKDGGWWSFHVETAPTNKEAMATMGILRTNNLKPFAEATDEGIKVSVRWIPTYQKDSVESALRALGYEISSAEPDENPYL